MHAKLAVGGVVVRDDGALLLVRRKDPPDAGRWTLPGGHVEPGESPHQAVVREVMEETAVPVAVVRTVEVFPMRRPDAAFDIHEILCRPASSAEPRAGDDASDARWARADELADLGVSEAVRAVIARARDLL